MENKHIKLVDVLNRFNEALKNLTKTVQLIKEHDEKYKHLYDNANHTPQKQI